MTGKNGLDEAVANSAALAPPAGKRLTPWLAVAALVLLQYGLFAESVRREIAWFVPTNCDQCVYLNISYRVYEVMLSDGVFVGIKHGLSEHLANGSLFQVFVPLLFLVLGPSRLTALTVSFLLFAGFQCALVGTLRWYTRRWSVAFFGLGLLLAASTPFYAHGGLLDARFDLGAFSLYGLLACAVVRSEVFQSRRWALVVGLAAVVLTLYRHITVVYVAGTLVVCLGFFAFRMWFAAWDQTTRRLAWKQVTGTLLVGVMVAAVLVPVLWRKRDALWVYYVVGTQLGDEKEVRATEMGINSQLDHWLYYAQSAARDHAGKVFLGLGVLGLGAALVGWRLARRLPVASLTPDGPAGGVSTRSVCVFLGALLAVPYAILTYTVSKSPVVGNILIVPVLGFLLLPMMTLVRRLAPNQPRAVTVGLKTLAFVAVAAGLASQVRFHSRHHFWAQHRADAEQVVALHDAIVKYSSEYELKAPSYATDMVVDYLFADAINAWAYEKHNLLLGTNQCVGGDLMQVDEKFILDGIRKSDIVVLSNGSAYAQSVYPFNRRMETLRPRVRAYCEQELIHVKSFLVRDSNLELYVRPQVVVHGESGGWVTSKGLSVTSRGEMLRRAPTIELCGQIVLAPMGKVPGVSVTLQCEKAAIAVPATMDVTGDQYRLRFTLPVDQMPAGAVEIFVKFDRYFVPRDLGINEDARQLVVRWPSEVKALCQGSSGQ
jgi:hypothetical protein